MNNIDALSQDVRIERIDSLKTPAEIASEFPLSPDDKRAISSFRSSVN